MAVYSISDLEKLTGIKAATLRAWEQRYEIITPKRTDTNIRYYLDEDLRQLLNVALLNKNGMRISKIASLSRDERAEKVASISSINVSPDTQLDALTLSTVEMDEFKFSHIIDKNIHQRGFEETLLEVVYPFLDKLGLLYFTGSINPVQEAFISNLIRRKIIAATDALPPQRQKRSPVFCLYLPDGERQELSLLFINYLLRKRRFSTIYLGADVGVADLADATRCTTIDYLFTIFSNAFIHEPVEQHVKSVLHNCPDATLLLTGYQATLHDFGDNSRVRVVSGLEEMLLFVQRLK
ncbi:MerR family transcriptional regulator [Neolewinella lacunae]|uniref:MerR family transcriptional regulator n=1 Tax=Neolewinella lacunae TaxID=1517758 RepID=A0A923PES0_9BACT|nr:MerR family transcriptional regulator [Neolewinella lacunae]MBC6992717.1 MerR family transcriptional regulator [Neolewinella lacunae]MDN3635961.1 MerR family transcriptional regulator [Neolewinella lacunae]